MLVSTLTRKLSSEQSCLAFNHVLVPERDVTGFLRAQSKLDVLAWELRVAVTPTSGASHYGMGAELQPGQPFLQQYILLIHSERRFPFSPCF